MRVVLKSTVVAVFFYLLLLGGLAGWMEYELRSVAASLMEGTARLLGSQIAAALSGTALDQLVEAHSMTRQRLVQMVADLTKRSNVVASISVVDHDGRVMVSDEMEVGRQLAIPESIFQGSMRAQLLGPQSPFEGGQYHVFVPLLQGDGIVGYIRLSLASHRIASLYRHARNRLFVAALVGFLWIGAVGLTLHRQLARRSAALAQTLEATARGEEVPVTVKGDEFSQVIEAAGELGRELFETRERTTQAQRRISALGNVMDVGVILLAADQKIEFANNAARELLGCNATGDLEACWTELQDALVTAFDNIRSVEPPAPVDVDRSVDGRARHLRLEVHGAGEDTHEGYVVLLKDRDLLEAFETDLRLATHMRGLARVYGALAHELKAPLAAMGLNLELLNDALNTDDEDVPEIVERRRRYAAVLRAELARLNRSLIAVLNQTATLNETRQPLDACELLRDIEALLSPQAAHQGVALTVELPDLPVAVTGHRDRLKQALLNLAVNALEVMPDGGRMHVSLVREADHAIIAVRDSGPGIPPEILNKIYSMHFTTKDGGTGIGLYVARSVVEAHDGEMDVDSDPIRGTCFRVRLPLSVEDWETSGQ
jgi:signal transduction histidine kinase